MRKKITSIIGWREWIALPDLKINQIKVKVDTGAQSSALHANNVKIISRRGLKKARFTLYSRSDDPQEQITVEAPLVEHRHIKSSSGHRERRPVIMTSIQIGEACWPIEITLTNRDVMGFRMLLGRQAIRGRFMVDPGKSFLTQENVSRTKRRLKL